jgi:hypothetical protein
MIDQNSEIYQEKMKIAIRIFDYIDEEEFRSPILKFDALDSKKLKVASELTELPRQEIYDTLCFIRVLDEWN